MENITIVFEKIIYLILLIGCGVVIKKVNFISDKGVEDLSKIVVDFFWPALIFYQITATLNAPDIINNLSLPLFAALTGITGYLLGLLFVKIFRFQDDAKKIFLYNSTVNNFVFMVIPFVEIFFPKNGLGLLFVHNIGYILIIWTIGVSVFQEKFDFKKSIMGLLNPGFITTLIAIIITLSGLNKFIPKIAEETFKTMGTPTLAVSMIVVGAKIYNLGKEAFKFDLYNVLIGVNRLLIIPGILFLIALLLKNYFPKEVLGIFMLVNVMPVSIISVSMALRFNSDANLAAQNIVSNHLISIFTIPAFIVLIKIFFL